MKDKILEVVLDPRVVSSFFTLITALAGRELIGGFLRNKKEKEGFLPGVPADTGPGIFRKDMPLTLHYVFGELRKYRDLVTNVLDMGSEAKTNAFKDFLIHYIDISGAQLYRIAEFMDEACSQEGCTGVSCSISGYDIVKYNEDAYRNIKDLYKTYYRTAGSGYDDADRDTLDFVRACFDHYHMVGMGFLESSIQCMTRNSKFTECARTLQAQIFAAYQAVYINLLMGTEDTLRKTNGFFENKTFRAREYPVPEWYKRKES